MAPPKKKPSAAKKPKKGPVVKKPKADPKKAPAAKKSQPSRGYGASPPSEWMKLLFAVLVVAIIGSAVALATSVAAGNPPATPSTPAPGTGTATPGTMMPTPAPTTPGPSPTPAPGPAPPSPPTPVEPPGPVSALTMVEIGLIAGAVALVVLGAALLMFRVHDRRKYGRKLGEYTAVNRSDDAESVTSDVTENTSLMRASSSSESVT